MKITLKKVGAIPRTVSQASVAVASKQQQRPKPVASKYTSLTGPSHNAEAEMAVLGSCMIETLAVRTARNILKPEMFYIENNRTIFKMICDAFDENNAVDVVLVGERLRAAGKLLECGGMEHLVSCVNSVAYAGHVEHYGKAVATLHYNREIIRTCKAMQENQESTFVEKIRELVMVRENLVSPSMLEYQKDGLMDFLDNLLAQKDGAGINTGIKEIDFSWNGQKPGEVNTWGAATNEGKSIMLLTLLNLAARSRRCLYFGTEMKASETVQRHLSMVSGISAWKIRKPRLEKNEIERLQGVIADDLYKMPISIVDDPDPSLERIEAAIHASKAEIVFLDYLERFDMPRAENLRLQIKEFMRRIKTMARRHNVVIHLAAQLNRSTYGDVEKPPTMADLSESSAIEKESDRVMLFWSPKKKQIPNSQGKRVIEVLQMKNRQGPRGVRFDFVLNEDNLQMSIKKDFEDEPEKQAVDSQVKFYHQIKMEEKQSGVRTKKIIRGQ